MLAQLGAREDAEKRVVILGGNRIELVIVALRAGYGQAEKAARSDIDAIVLKFGAERVEAKAGRELPAPPADRRRSGPLRTGRTACRR